MHQQHYPPPQWQPANPSLYALPAPLPPPPPHRSRAHGHRTYPASSMKKTSTMVNSTSSVWGGSTAVPHDGSDSDSDDDGTVAALSIASSQSLAPGNKPHQQRRVAHWLKETSQHRSPSNPFTTGGSSKGHHRHEPHHHHNHDGPPQRELPPVWVPRHMAGQQQQQQPPSSGPFLQPTAPRQAQSQRNTFLPSTVPMPQPQLQYPPPPPMHGAPRTDGAGFIPYVPPPRTVVVQASHGTRSKTDKSDGKDKAKGRKRTH
ncbi:hypothetical protein C8R46DRAFT_36842 [Mycena filopes]|nr:hypothetical protein C8R46DRAFT_36842 [Mycena filopes]